MGRFISLSFFHFLLLFLVIECIFCSDIKQRYNTFHLTTDGAESLSMIGCIEICHLNKKSVNVDKNSHLPSFLTQQDKAPNSRSDTEQKQVGGLITVDSTGDLNSHQGGFFEAIQQLKQLAEQLKSLQSSSKTANNNSNNRNDQIQDNNNNNNNTVTFRAHPLQIREEFNGLTKASDREKKTK